MLKKTFYAAAVLAFTVSLALPQGKGGGGKGAPKGPGMALTSPDIQDGGIIDDKYTQAVPMPISPKLEWTNVPMATESFVLIMHDPDNALNKGTDDVLHWLVFNIPGTARSLAGSMDSARRHDPGQEPSRHARLHGSGERGHQPVSSLHLGAVRAGCQADAGSGCDARGCDEGHGRSYRRQGCAERPLQAIAVAYSFLRAG